jgi:sterol desaturase/sphingolipid hydroxylase (fatty acid hydroxylase superfamily)
MILLFFIGAVFVYALIFMAILVGLMAVALSLCIYALTYMITYGVAKIRHRNTPEWKFDKKPWTPDHDLVQSIAVTVGIFSLAGMVIGFFTYAFSEGDWGVTIGITTFILVIAGIGMANEIHEENQREAAINPPPVEPKS